MAEQREHPHKSQALVSDVLLYSDYGDRLSLLERSPVPSLRKKGPI